MRSNIDHTCMSPKGRVSRTQRGQTKIDKGLQRLARLRSQVATTRLMAKLKEVRIIEGDDSSWLVVSGDEVLGRFASAGDAVAAL